MGSAVLVGKFLAKFAYTYYILYRPLWKVQSKTVLVKPGLIWEGQEQSEPEDMDWPLLTNNSKYVRKRKQKSQLSMYYNCVSLTRTYYLKITKGGEKSKDRTCHLIGNNFRIFYITESQNETCIDYKVC